MDNPPPDHLKGGGPGGTDNNDNKDHQSDTNDITSPESLARGIQLPTTNPISSSSSSQPHGSAHRHTNNNSNNSLRLRGMSMTDSVGWNSLADLSEFELDGEIDSDISADELDLMLISAVVSGAKHIEVTVETDDDSSDSGLTPNDDDDDEDERRSTATITLPDEMFAELLVAAAASANKAANTNIPVRNSPSNTHNISKNTSLSTVTNSNTSGGTGNRIATLSRKRLLPPPQSSSSSSSSVPPTTTTTTTIANDSHTDTTPGTKESSDNNKDPSSSSSSNSNITSALNAKFDRSSKRKQKSNPAVLIPASGTTSIKNNESSGTNQPSGDLPVSNTASTNSSLLSSPALTAGTPSSHALSHATSSTHHHNRMTLSLTLDPEAKQRTLSLADSLGLRLVPNTPSSMVPHSIGTTSVTSSHLTPSGTDHHSSSSSSSAKVSSIFTAKSTDESNTVTTTLQQLDSTKASHVPSTGSTGGEQFFLSPYKEKSSSSSSSTTTETHGIQENSKDGTPVTSSSAHKTDSGSGSRLFYSRPSFNSIGGHSDSDLHHLHQHKNSTSDISIHSEENNNTHTNTTTGKASHTHHHHHSSTSSSSSSASHHRDRFDSISLGMNIPHSNNLGFGLPTGLDSSSSHSGSHNALNSLLPFSPNSTSTGTGALLTTNGSSSSSNHHLLDGVPSGLEGIGLALPLLPSSTTGNSVNNNNNNNPSSHPDSVQSNISGGSNRGRKPSIDLTLPAGSLGLSIPLSLSLPLAAINIRRALSGRPAIDPNTIDSLHNNDMIDPNNPNNIIEHHNVDLPMDLNLAPPPLPITSGPNSNSHSNSHVMRLRVRGIRPLVPGMINNTNEDDDTMMDDGNLNPHTDEENSNTTTNTTNAITSTTLPTNKDKNDKDNMDTEDENETNRSSKEGTPTKGKDSSGSGAKAITATTATPTRDSSGTVTPKNTPQGGNVTTNKTTNKKKGKTTTTETEKKPTDAPTVTTETATVSSTGKSDTSSSSAKRKNLTGKETTTAALGKSSSSSSSAPVVSTGSSAKDNATGTKTNTPSRDTDGTAKDGKTDTDKPTTTTTTSKMASKNTASNKGKSTKSKSGTETPSAQTITSPVSNASVLLQSRLHDDDDIGGYSEDMWRAHTAMQGTSMLSTLSSGLSATSSSNSATGTSSSSTATKTPANKGKTDSKSTVSKAKKPTTTKDSTTTPSTTAVSGTTLTGTGSSVTTEKSETSATITKPSSTATPSTANTTSSSTTTGTKKPAEKSTTTTPATTSKSSSSGTANSSGPKTVTETVKPNDPMERERRRIYVAREHALSLLKLVGSIQDPSLTHPTPSNRSTTVTPSNVSAARGPWRPALVKENQVSNGSWSLRFIRDPHYTNPSSTVVTNNENTLPTVNDTVMDNNLPDTDTLLYCDCPEENEDVPLLDYDKNTNRFIHMTNIHNVSAYRKAVLTSPLYSSVLHEWSHLSTRDGLQPPPLSNGTTGASKSTTIRGLNQNQTAKMIVDQNALPWWSWPDPDVQEALQSLREQQEQFNESSSTSITTETMDTGEENNSHRTGGNEEGSSIDIDNNDDNFSVLSDDRSYASLSAFQIDRMQDFTDSDDTYSASKLKKNTSSSTTTSGTSTAMEDDEHTTTTTTGTACSSSARGDILKAFNVLSDIDIDKPSSVHLTSLDQMLALPWSSLLGIPELLTLLNERRKITTEATKTTFATTVAPTVTAGTTTLTSTPSSSATVPPTVGSVSSSSTLPSNGPSVATNTEIMSTMEALQKQQKYLAQHLDSSTSVPDSARLATSRVNDVLMKFSQLLPANTSLLRPLEYRTNDGNRYSVLFPIYSANRSSTDTTVNVRSGASPIDTNDSSTPSSSGKSMRMIHLPGGSVILPVRSNETSTTNTKSSTGSIRNTVLSSSTETMDVDNTASKDKKDPHTMSAETSEVVPSLLTETSIVSSIPGLDYTVIPYQNRYFVRPIVRGGLSLSSSMNTNGNIDNDHYNSTEISSLPLDMSMAVQSAQVLSRNRRQHFLNKYHKLQQHQQHQQQQQQAQQQQQTIAAANKELTTTASNDVTMKDEPSSTTTSTAPVSTILPSSVPVHPRTHTVASSTSAAASTATPISGNTVIPFSETYPPLATEFLDTSNSLVRTAHHTHSHTNNHSSSTVHLQSLPIALQPKSYGKPMLTIPVAVPITVPVGTSSTRTHILSTNLPLTSTLLVKLANYRKDGKRGMNNYNNNNSNFSSIPTVKPLRFKFTNSTKQSSLIVSSGGGEMGSMFQDGVSISTATSQTNKTVTNSTVETSATNIPITAAKKQQNWLLKRNYRIIMDSLSRLKHQKENLYQLLHHLNPQSLLSNPPNKVGKGTDTMNDSNETMDSIVTNNVTHQETTTPSSANLVRTGTTTPAPTYASRLRIRGRYVSRSILEEMKTCGIPLHSSTVYGPVNPNFHNNGGNPNHPSYSSSGHNSVMHNNLSSSSSTVVTNNISISFGKKPGTSNSTTLLLPETGTMNTLNGNSTGSSSVLRSSSSGTGTITNTSTLASSSLPSTPLLTCPPSVTVLRYLFARSLYRSGNTKEGLQIIEALITNSTGRILSNEELNRIKDRLDGRSMTKAKPSTTVGTGTGTKPSVTGSLTKGKGVIVTGKGGITTGKGVPGKKGVPVNTKGSNGKSSTSATSTASKRPLSAVDDDPKGKGTNKAPIGKKPATVSTDTTSTDIGDVSSTTPAVPPNKKAKTSSKPTTESAPEGLTTTLSSGISKKGTKSSTPGSSSHNVTDYLSANYLSSSLDNNDDAIAVSNMPYHQNYHNDDHGDDEEENGEILDTEEYYDPLLHPAQTEDNNENNDDNNTVDEDQDALNNNQDNEIILGGDDDSELHSELGEDDQPNDLLLNFQHHHNGGMLNSHSISSNLNEFDPHNGNGSSTMMSDNTTNHENNNGEEADDDYHYTFTY